ncbi:MAG TPA: 50S ribosomal protein L13 [Candidatus Nanoarchaeia archaeon]|nr:50S ribosomal protein L13 [Candidatus Nanoarchaeia archaeon]
MMLKLILDADGMIAGRLCSFAAKSALEGFQVEIVNAEKAVVTGPMSRYVQRERDRRNRTDPRWGPFTTKMPDRFLRRMVRGMLDYKKLRGKTAFGRVMCHIGVPLNLAQEKLHPLSVGMSVKKLKHRQFTTIGEICKQFGGSQ